MNLITLIRKYDLPMDYTLNIVYGDNPKIDVYNVMALEVSDVIEKGIADDIIKSIKDCVMDVFGVTPTEYLENSNKYILDLPKSTECVGGIYFLINEGICFYLGSSHNIPTRIKAHRLDKTFDDIRVFQAYNNREYESILTYLGSCFTAQQYTNTNKTWIKEISNKWLYGFYDNNKDKMPQVKKFDFLYQNR